MELTNLTQMPNTMPPNMGPILSPMVVRLPRHVPGLRRRDAHVGACDLVTVESCWVLNMAQPKQIEVHVELRNKAMRLISGQLRLQVVDPRDGRVLATNNVPVSVTKDSNRKVTCPMHAPDAEVWEFDNQHLYQLQVSWQASGHRVSPRSTLLDFAFLEFPVEGVGQDAMFRTRNRKLRLRAVIPWSRWTMDALAPM